MKKQHFTGLQWAKYCLALSLGLTLSSCVDDSYDVSKDIDMTMGFGANGLQLKLGNTEKIMLADILEESQNLKTDGSHTYYLVENGNTDVDFNVDKMNAYIDNAMLSPQVEVLDYEKLASLFPSSSAAVNVPANFVYNIENLSASSQIHFDVKNIGEAIKQVKAITPVSGTKLNIRLALEQNGMRFAIRDVDNLKITLPKYIVLGQATNATVSGQVLSFGTRHNINATSVDLGSVGINDIVFEGNSGVVSGGTLDMPNTNISLSGNFKIYATQGFTPVSSSNLTLHVYVSIGNQIGGQSEMQFSEVTGRFDPEIAPTINNINIADNLPDFLQGDDVTIHVSNPTLKFMADMSAVPASIAFNAGMSSFKDNAEVKAISLPADGTATLVKKQKNNIYFYEDAAAGPYTPAGMESGAVKYNVGNLSSLIEKLPDYISVDLKKNRRVHLVDEDVTIQLNHTYHANMGYELYVPFTFENGLKIVYNDSITDMNKDLKDYEASGLAITAKVLNAVPLQLIASAVPVDVNGRVVEGIEVTSATIAPAREAAVVGNAQEIDKAGVDSDIQIDITLSNPKDLKRVDALRLRIDAEGTQTGNATLSSNQYIKIKDIRLKLKGQVVGDFN